MLELELKLMYLFLNFLFCLRRYFVNETSLNDHAKTKIHKRRLKALQMEPYTQEEANRAAGQGSYTKPKPAVHDDVTME